MDLLESIVILERQGYLVVDLHSHCKVVVGFSIECRAGYRLGPDLTTKDSADHVVVLQRSVQPLDTYGKTDEYVFYTIRKGMECMGLTETQSERRSAYLARWIHFSVSGGSSLRPRERLLGGSALPPVACLRAFSSSRMPEGCCRLARQVELTEAGWRCSRSRCWRLMSWTHGPVSRTLLWVAGLQWTL